MNDPLEKLKYNFENKSISTEVILSKIKLLNSNFRNHPSFNDNKYFPFYYRLGCEIDPTSVCQIGPVFGLIGAAFLKGCKSVNEWVIFDKKSSIVFSNIKGSMELDVEFCDLHQNNYKDNYFKFGMISDNLSGSSRTLDCMYFIWDKVCKNSYILVDYICDQKDDFYKFCSIKNREPVFFNTRYGVGIIKK